MAARHRPLVWNTAQHLTRRKVIQIIHRYLSLSRSFFLLQQLDDQVRRPTKKELCFFKYKYMYTTSTAEKGSPFPRAQVDPDRRDLYDVLNLYGLCTCVFVVSFYSIFFSVSSIFQLFKSSNIQPSYSKCFHFNSARKFDLGAIQDSFK